VRGGRAADVPDVLQVALEVRATRVDRHESSCLR
jgi:hypothetical protein